MGATKGRVVYVGIDPATTTGVCIVDGADVRSGIVADPLRFYDSEIGKRLISFTDCRVVAAIERPPAGLHGSAVPRWIGGRIGDELRRLYPRRTMIVMPTPTVWQRAVLGDYEGDTKAASVSAAENLCGRSVGDHNEGDAICLAHYAMRAGS